MITKLHGKTLINLAFAGTALTAGNLQAQSVPPEEIFGHCNYGDCAIFHECTDYHDQENLKELNSKGIIARAVLAPVEQNCHSYGCFTDEAIAAKKDAECARSKKLAQLVLHAREIDYIRE